MATPKTFRRPAVKKPLPMKQMPKTKVPADRFNTLFKPRGPKELDLNRRQTEK